MKLVKEYLQIIGGIIIMIVIGAILLALFPIIGIVLGILVYSHNLKIKKVTKMQAMKDAVLVAAKALAHPNNTFTTLEIKEKLINDHPHYMWKQKFVSDAMDEYALSGTFTYTDNGTFRTYSDPNYNFPSTQATAMSATILPKRGTKAGVKRGSYVTKAIRAAMAATLHKRGSKAGIKRGPYNTKNKSVVASPLITPALPTVKVKNPNHNVKAISKTEAAIKIENAHGKFGSAVFIKRDNTERHMNFKVVKDAVQSKLGYVRVIDMTLYNQNRAKGLSKMESEKVSTRQMNLQTMKKLTLDGKTNKVR